MKRWAWAAVGVMAFAHPGRADVTKEDIAKLLDHQISDDVIIAYVQAYGPVAIFSSEDLVELKTKGASDRVILELLKIKAENAEKVKSTTPQRPVQELERSPERPRRERIEQFPVASATPSYVYVRSVRRGCRAEPAFRRMIVQQGCGW